MYEAQVIQVNILEGHPRADRLQVLRYGSETFVVGIDVQVGDVMVLFGGDGELSHDFCHENNLYRDPLKNKNPKKKGFFEDNRRVRAQPFRGVKSYGFVAGFESFSYLKKFTPDVGMSFSEWNGKEVCKKYYTPATLKAMRNVEANGAKQKLVEYSIAEHFSTKKLTYYVPDIKPNTLAIITEKVHGTSARTGNVIVSRHGQNIFQKALSGLLRRFVATTAREYEYVSGTRRTIINRRVDITTEGERDYYRWDWHNKIAHQLHKGETVYYEIAGFDCWGAGIMDTQDISKRTDTPDYWDDNMRYRYGCEDGENDAYVYRITMTNVDGRVEEIPWSRVVSRSAELGLKSVPVLEFFVPENTEQLMEVVDEYMTNSPSTLDNRHLMEGVCIRLESEQGTEVLKEKNWLFGILEGYLKESSEYVDAEEAN